MKRKDKPDSPSREASPPPYPPYNLSLLIEAAREELRGKGILPSSLSIYHLLPEMRRRQLTQNRKDRTHADK